MKLKIVGLALCFIPILGWAQEKSLIMGVSVNPGASWISSDNAYFESEGSQFLFNYGIDMDLYFNTNYAFSTGLQIIHYGGKVSYPDLWMQETDTSFSNTRSTSTLKYTAIHIPAYLKLKTNPIGYNSYYAEFGTSILFPIKATEEVETLLQTGGSQSTPSDNVLDETTFASVNLLLGAGIELPISGDTRAQLGIQFLNGLTSFSKGKAYETNQDGSVSEEELNNGGNPSGSDISYRLRGIYLKLKIVF
jgi:hypothetical protein